MCLEQVCSVASGSLDGDESFRVRVIGGSIGIADREAFETDSFVMFDEFHVGGHRLSNRGGESSGLR